MHANYFESNKISPVLWSVSERFGALFYPERLVPVSECDGSILGAEAARESQESELSQEEAQPTGLAIPSRSLFQLD